MKSGVKTALSLLLTVIIFTGITIASALGAFSNVEKSFYEPAKLKFFQNKLNSAADYCDVYINNLLSQLGSEPSGFMANEAVLSFAEISPDDAILKKINDLNQNLNGLEGLRVVDAGGKKVHYSTFKTDYRLDANRRIYLNYQDLKTSLGRSEIDFSVIDCISPKQNRKLLFDGENQRLIACYPFEKDEKSFNVIFYVSTRALSSSLVENRIAAVNDSVLLVSDSEMSSGGFVFALPNSFRDQIAPEILRSWKENLASSEIAVSSEAGSVFQKFTLISADCENGLKFSELVSNEALELPEYVRILLLICAFISIGLVILIIFSLRRDDDVIIRDRIKRVEFEFLSEYFAKDLDRNQIAGLVQEKKDLLSAKIKKSLGKRGKKHEPLIDQLLENSWDEIISILTRTPESSEPQLQLDEIRRMFEEIVSKAHFTVNQVVQPASVGKSPVKKQPVQEVEELEDAEAVEEIETVEELEDAEAVEEIEAVEELEDAEAVEEIEAVEELEDAEAVEEIEAVEELEDAEAVEEIEAVEELEDAENIEKLEEAETEEEILEDVESLEQEAEEALEDVTENSSEMPVEKPVSAAEDLLDMAKMPYFDFSSFLIDNTVGSRSSGRNNVLQIREPLVFSDGALKNESSADISVVDSFSVSKPGELIVGLTPFEKIAKGHEKSIDETIVDYVEEAEFVEDVAQAESADVEAEPVDDEVAEIDAIVEAAGDDVEPADEVVEPAEDDVEPAGDDVEPADEVVEAAGDDVEPADEAVEAAEEIAEPFEEEFADAEDVEQLEEAPFMMTNFAANDDGIEVIPLDPIVSDENGIYTIAKNLIPSGVVLDKKFKDLVDSVMNKD